MGKRKGKEPSVSAKKVRQLKTDDTFRLNRSAGVDSIWLTVKQFRAVMLLSPQQTGKTWLLKELESYVKRTYSDTYCVNLRFERVSGSTSNEVLSQFRKEVAETLSLNVDGEDQSASALLRRWVREQDDSNVDNAKVIFVDDYEQPIMWLFAAESESKNDEWLSSRDESVLNEILHFYDDLIMLRHEKNDYFIMMTGTTDLAVGQIRKQNELEIFSFHKDFQRMKNVFGVASTELSALYSKEPKYPDLLSICNHSFTFFVDPSGISYYTVEGVKTALKKTGICAGSTRSSSVYVNCCAWRFLINSLKAPDVVCRLVIKEHPYISEFALIEKCYKVHDLFDKRRALPATISYLVQAGIVRQSERDGCFHYELSYVVEDETLEKLLRMGITDRSMECDVERRLLHNYIEEENYPNLVTSIYQLFKGFLPCSENHFTSDERIQIRELIAKFGLKIFISKDTNRYRYILQNEAGHGESDILLINSCELICIEAKIMTRKVFNEIYKKSIQSKSWSEQLSSFNDLLVANMKQLSTNSCAEVHFQRYLSSAPFGQRLERMTSICFVFCKEHVCMRVQDFEILDSRQGVCWLKMMGKPNFFFPDYGFLTQKEAYENLFHFAHKNASKL